MLDPVGIFAITPILRASAGLRIGGPPRLWAQRAQGGRGMKCARSHLHVVGLKDDAASRGPKLLQGQDQPLERFCREQLGRGHRISSKRASTKGALKIVTAPVREAPAREIPTIFPPRPNHRRRLDTRKLWCSQSTARAWPRSTTSNNSRGSKTQAP